MACAASKRSLPYSRGGVNPRRPEKSQTRARCAARTAVLTDKRLTMGARVLYCLLDDYAGFSPECWPHQDGMAARLGRSVRSVKRWIAELVAVRHIAIRRTQSGNRYRLAWTVPENNASEQIGPSEVPAAARAYSEPDQELTVDSNSSIETLDGSGWEFGLDDAVRIFEWASRTAGD